MNLFTVSSIGAIIQDGGKRKRSTLMWAWFALLGFQSGRVEFIVSFATLCKIVIVVSKMRPITLSIF